MRRSPGKGCRFRINNETVALAAIRGISILRRKAASARRFDTCAQLFGGLLRLEGTDLDGIEHAALALVLAPNRRFAPFQHGIFRLQRPECRLRLGFALRSRELDHEAAAFGEGRLRGGLALAGDLPGRR